MSNFLTTILLVFLGLCNAHCTLEDHDKKCLRQDKILREYEQTFEKQNEQLKQQDEILKMYERKLEIQKLRRSVAEGAAFSVQLSVKQTHIGLKQTIKYDKVHLNDGNGYSVHSGVFTAPQSGVYMFSYFLGHGYEPAQAWLELMHNGDKINAVVFDTFHSYED
ncbi:uncharacterized protein LOC123541482 [Mercenaria mercenaria]|uniref:uncharacterized protein LOC123541482 n=1 Tax=Mercenaria mercenaria TaxID=6596 RepID=UPI00234E3B00|nr:uncharacterized protein LOC123541482 [Mercenaria mercenaria]